MAQTALESGAVDDILERELNDVCALPLVRRVAALLDLDPYVWREGMALPFGWDFVLFAPVTPQSHLRPDGHHLFEPTASEGPTTKAMLGGRRFRYVQPVTIGAPVSRLCVGNEVKHREGRAGPLTIVTRRHHILIGEEGRIAIEEEEDMVYRPSDAVVPAAAPSACARQSLADRVYLPDEAMLFRYSALTNNAHRIHYDLAFAHQVEGYPALVVNGGLTALLLVEMFRSFTGEEPTSSRYQMMRPLFCNRPVRIRIDRATDGYRIWAENEIGQLAAEAIIQ